MKRHLLLTAILAAAVFIIVGPTHLLAWHAPGHQRATNLAITSLPADAVPAFFSQGVATIAHLAIEPDLFRKPIAPDALDDAISPEHYCDLELLGDAPLPPTRYAMLRLCYDNDLDPKRVGLAPYAVIEWTQRLTIAFAEHRRWPDNPHIQAKCLVYAGTLAHYAQDITQPLHTTIHYNGRVDANGLRADSDIHQRIDALPGKLPADQQPDVDVKAVQPTDDLFAAIVAQLQASHALVDTVYDLEADLPAPDEALDLEGPAADFARDRLATAAAFTAKLYATAWQDSADIELPDWHNRPAVPPVPVTPAGAAAEDAPTD